MTQGVVAKITAKDWTDPESGDVTKLYSFKIEDGEWYRTGANNPAKFGVREGASITFSLDGKGKPILKTIKVGETQAPARSPAPRAASSSKDDYWAKKEENDKAKDARYQAVDIPRMTFCGAQETAVKVVELALSQGALDISKVKQAAKLDTLIATIDQVATTLFHSRMNSPSLLETGETSTNNNNSEDETDNDTGTGSYDDDE